MGGEQSVGMGLDGVIERAENRVGKIQVSGRYHRSPRKLAEDYNRSTEVLGSGYNGQVFQATRKTDQMKVAVKGFKLHGVGKEKKSELELEVEIFLSMDHPHIARLTDVYESEDQLELVMECMTGGELFDRVVEKKSFTEQDASDAARQMLLAISYIHSRGIVHRDIKLENYLYENEEKTHLKLIDFGFSKIWQPNTKMNLSCGTLAYVAPEVLDRRYDSQCDMWSFGVTIFIMLFGYMPFSGPEDQQMTKIKQGRYTVKEKVWQRVGAVGQEFVKRLLVVDPKNRFTATQALDHKFIKDHEGLKRTTSGASVDQEVANAFISFSQASAFRRSCMSMMAWSLTADDRAQVRDAFLEMDRDRTGTIKLHEFKQVLEDQFHMSDSQTMQAFKALDTNHDDQVHYSDFLAAMVSSRIALHDDVLQTTFARFDTDRSGSISKENLKEVLGPTCTDAEVDQILSEADKAKDGKISYAEWIEYLRGGTANDAHAEVAARVIDQAINTSTCKESKEAKKSTMKSRRTLPTMDGKTDQMCGCVSSCGVQ